MTNPKRTIWDFMACLIIGAVSFAIVSVVGSLYILYNLAHYSVYYADKLPHGSNTHPEVAMIVEHLYWIEKIQTEAVYDIDSLDGDFRMKPLKLYLGRRTAIMEEGEVDGFSVTPYGQEDSDWIYYFDRDGRFLFYTPDKWADTPVKDSTPERAKKAYDLLDKMLSPYLKDYPKPVINLQWLFNWKYQDRFN